MGAHVAKLRRFVRTPTARIQNVDKILENKVVSPRHPSSVKAFDELIKSHPEFKVAIKEKNDNLHKMLESVRVDSFGPAPDKVLKIGKRVNEIDIIPEGKLSHEQLDELYINRKILPEIWTEKQIALYYKLDETVARNLAMYFSSFRIYKQEEKTDLSIGDGIKSFIQNDVVKH